MAKYQQYEEYKNSGVEWLGEVPKDWQLSRIQESTSIINGHPFESSKFNPTKGMPLVRIRDIRHQKTEVFFDGVVPEAAVINDGDILIGMDGDFNVAKWTGGMAALNQRVACIRHKNPIIQSFLYYLLPYHMKIVNDLTYYTTVKHLSSNDILKTTFALPSENELKNIVNFLNHETAQIDTLIEKQQILIQLLKEKRQAVISHAVTKGLNPDAPMKDSGVEWVDVIPKHWKAYKLGYCANVGNGATPSRENSSFWKDGSISWLNSSKINDVIIREADQFITPLAKLQTSVQPVQENDLLIAITGEGQTRGRVAICKLEATINQHLASIRITDKELDYEYLYYWLNSNYSRIRFESSGAGSTKGAITCGDITSYPVLIPPKKEQQGIVKHIKEKNEVFDALIGNAEQAIQLMQERRTALISAAVTGKIDVRGWRASVLR